MFNIYKWITMLAVGLLCASMTHAQIDFNSLNVGTIAWGEVGATGSSEVIEAYGGKVFFITSGDGTSEPSKVHVYDPSMAQEHGGFGYHGVLLKDSDRFVALATMVGLLWISHSDGRLFSYDGICINEDPTVPFSTQNAITAMCEFNGVPFVGTHGGDVYRYSKNSWVKVLSSGNAQVECMVVWNGRLYCSMRANGLGTNAVLCSTMSGDPGGWTITPLGVWSVPVLVDSPEYLYGGFLNSAVGYVSSLRRSEDGTYFETIDQSSGEYKHPLDGIYYEGWSYMAFDKTGSADNCYLIQDDGIGSTQMNPDRVIFGMTALDGYLYTLQAKAPFGSLSRLLLLTNAPVPCRSDIVPTGTVDVDDLLKVINNWGTCK